MQFVLMTEHDALVFVARTPDVAQTRRAGPHGLGPRPG